MVSLPTILLILAAISFGATVIATLVAIRSAREARSAIFPIVREEETVRARRARITVFVMSAITALFLGGWLATLRLAPTSSDPVVANVTPTQPAALTFVTETPTLPAQALPQPTTAAPASVEPPVQVTDTPAVASAPPNGVEATPPLPPAPSPTPVPPSPTPTHTSTPLPPTATFTPTPAAIAQFVTPVSRTPAPPGIKIGPIQFATKITSNIEAINPTDAFPQNTRSVYAVYPYSGMVDGLDFAAVWYQNGQELWRDEQVWRWGKTAQFYSFLNPPGEGLYKLDLYVNDTVVATGLFEIR